MLKEASEYFEKAYQVNAQAFMSFVSMDEINPDPNVKPDSTKYFRQLEEYNRIMALSKKEFKEYLKNNSWPERPSMNYLNRYLSANLKEYFLDKDYYWYLQLYIMKEWIYSLSLISQFDISANNLSASLYYDYYKGIVKAYSEDK